MRYDGKAWEIVNQKCEIPISVGVMKKTIINVGKKLLQPCLFLRMRIILKKL
jgi:hypothetical protein